MCIVIAAIVNTDACRISRPGGYFEKVVKILLFSLSFTMDIRAKTFFPSLYSGEGDACPYSVVHS